ncbi:hypothetical protein VSR89_15735 [Klebsiella pneumoniae]|uniref:hypothetical protein n=1 Tax=Klebsiella pneumoniae TaxID=573 RepID=UPI002DBDE2F2|nr:hypothetical protein [Klebsiella pneumoniae]MEC4509520.1 hypothetical protein [Klebsiella pneumoniae]HDO6739796.1 hypothetical protein [Klebsiella pneumoniae]
MELSIVESIKLAAPFFQIIVTVILIPLIQKGYESRRTFFSLPLQKKMDAIAYLKSHQPSDNKLEKAKHKIIMGGYRLSNDVNFSRKIIEYYYDNEETNARFCKAILSERYYYCFENGVIKTRKIKYHVNIMIYIITILLYINLFYVKSSTVIYNAHFPAEPVIIIATGIYSYLSWRILRGYLSIRLNKKRFYNFLRQDNS